MFQVAPEHILRRPLQRPARLCSRSMQQALAHATPPTTQARPDLSAASGRQPRRSTGNRVASSRSREALRSRQEIRDFAMVILQYEAKTTALSD